MKNIENSAGTMTQMSPAAEDNIFLRKIINDVEHGIFPNEETLQEVDKIFDCPNVAKNKYIYATIIAFGRSENESLKQKAAELNKKINNTKNK